MFAISSHQAELVTEPGALQKSLCSSFKQTCSMCSRETLNEHHCPKTHSPLYRPMATGAAVAKHVLFMHSAPVRPAACSF